MELECFLSHGDWGESMDVARFLLSPFRGCRVRRTAPRRTAPHRTAPHICSDPNLVFLYFFMFFMASTAFCFFVSGESRGSQSRGGHSPAVTCVFGDRRRIEWQREIERTHRNYCFQEGTLVGDWRTYARAGLLLLYFVLWQTGVFSFFQAIVSRGRSGCPAEGNQSPSPHPSGSRGFLSVRKKRALIRKRTSQAVDSLEKFHTFIRWTHKGAYGGRTKAPGVLVADKLWRQATRTF